VAGDLTEIDDARRMVLEHAAPLGLEPVAVRDALGRVLAEPIVSAEPIPGFDNSAMDGYAVRSADLAGASADVPTPLAIVGEARAGHPAAEEVAPGAAIVISTGAMVPAGADAVVRLEDTDGSQTGVVAVRSPVPAGNNIRRAGEDAVAGAEVLATGAELGPAEIGVLASVGRARVACGRRPQIAVLTTGDELQEPGEPLRPGAVRNSNMHSLAALVEAAGAELAFAELVADTPEATRAALERALSCDVTIVSGGVSVGPHDHVRPALAELGVDQGFWGVALRPGKPTYFGVAPRMPGTGPSRGLVFGLPGNPVSALVTFLLFARPAIRVMLGAGPGRPQRTTAILTEDYPKRPGRAHLIRCRLELAEDGWRATPTKEQGSHVLTSMIGADALAILPSDSGDVAAGSKVEVELL
jgi:molybdopterin molybdotransferase